MSHTPSRAERRTSNRQPQLLKVVIHDPADALDEPYAGLLLNRSQGGLRLSIQNLDIEEGTILGVRPMHDSGEAHFISVRVMYRQRKDNTLELGCEFVQKRTA